MWGWLWFIQSHHSVYRSRLANIEMSWDSVQSSLSWQRNISPRKMYLTSGLFLPALQSSRGKTAQRERRGGQQIRTLEHQVNRATKQLSCCPLEIWGQNSAVEVRDSDSHDQYPTTAEIKVVVFVQQQQLGSWLSSKWEGGCSNKRQLNKLRVSRAGKWKSEWMLKKTKGYREPERSYLLSWVLSDLHQVSPLNPQLRSICLQFKVITKTHNWPECREKETTNAQV